MNTRQQLAEAINAGRAAAEEGAHVRTCPHPAGDLRRTAWIRGYAAAPPPATTDSAEA
ncbi:Rmf/CrpP fold protein [Streptomyces sp. NPDC059853]|uniref:Rmf/CrpP fold protein n=1 Tax=Streptomyces sp. NPDC059853 TaxID=3346973 RepID=UPI003662C2E1